MKDTTSAHVESSVEEQDSDDHYSWGHRVIQVIEGDRLEGNLRDQKWPFLINIHKSEHLHKQWTFHEDPP